MSCSDIDRLATQIEERSELLTAIESQLMERRIKATLLPTIVLVAVERVGSVFGRRLDPLAGVGAMHEGIDFVVDTGSRVVASAWAGSSQPLSIIRSMETSSKSITVTSSPRATPICPDLM